MKEYNYEERFNTNQKNLKKSMPFEEEEEKKGGFK